MANNRMALAQLRRGITAKINESLSTITGERIPMVDDGFGGQTIDPSGTPVEYSARVRISHERISVQDNESTPVGFSSSLGLFLLTDYSGPCQENDQVTDQNGRVYKVGPIDQLVRFGGVYATQTPLEIVSNPSEEST